MPRIRYNPDPWNPRAETRQLIADANAIMEEYEGQGFPLTLRGVYYQIVARDLFPESKRWRWTGRNWVRDANGTKNAQPNYTWLGRTLSRGRLAGLVDWEHLEDLTRKLRSLGTWDDGAAYTLPDGYQSDRWAEQPDYVEVWVEKDALSAVMWDVCKRFHVPLFAARGYPSASAMWETSQRLIAKRDAGADRVVVLHFGDHDPSGVDMTRDLRERWSTFQAEGVEVRRLALNMDQVERYNPPPSPAKETDSRSPDYVARFGNDSWELDALEPRVLHDLVEDELSGLIDRTEWEASDEWDEQERATLRLIQRHYDDVAEYVRKL